MTSFKNIKVIQKVKHKSINLRPKHIMVKIRNINCLNLPIKKIPLIDFKHKSHYFFAKGEKSKFK